MKKSNRILLIIIAVCIVTGGTAFGVLAWASWSVLPYENTYYYKPETPSPIERININCDIGSIKIKYNETSTDNYAQVDLDIQIKGILVEEKSFQDFFYPVIWQNESTQVISFILDAKASTWLTFSISQRVKINLTLRTDIIYDINTLTSTGSINMDIPDNSVLNNTILSTSTGLISLNAAKNTTFLGNVEISTSTGSAALFAKQVNFTHSLRASTTTGSLSLNFSECFIGNNLVGTVSTGSISFNSYNMKYSDDYIWGLETSTGSIDVNIIQNTEIVSNITGAIQTSTGSIDVYYKDNSANVGAKFTGSTSTGSIEYNPIGVGGFVETGSSNSKTITSNDFNSATNTYTFSLTTSTGSVEVNGESL
ncbi:MAG: hypothetical protein HWN81_19710 [Candidatus Lokiarchaeota archaeon]|nr:hypothetical protein [Candidatus Lokiarchaeota archaeon]